MATTAQADRKATNLQRKLARKYHNHSLQLLPIAYVLDGDIVVKVSSDNCPSLLGRDWLNPDLTAADLYRIACSVVDKAIQAEIDRTLAHDSWLAEIAAMDARRTAQQ